MKVVHINKPKIQQDGERLAFAAILLAKWEERGRRNAEKMYAALLEKRRMSGS